MAPAESGTTFSNCRAVGVKNGLISNCEFTASGSFNGEWQSVYVPIPNAYTCNDSSSTGCWVEPTTTSDASQAQDTTSSSSSIDGDPVPLVE